MKKNWNLLPKNPPVNGMFFFEINKKYEARADGSKIFAERNLFGGFCEIKFTYQRWKLRQLFFCVLELIVTILENSFKIR